MELGVVPPSGFDIGSLHIGFYGLIIASAALLAFFVAQRIAKYRDIDPDFVWLVAIIVIPAGIIGARFLHVVLNRDDYTLESAVAFWRGFEGLAIQGAIIFGFTSITVLCLVKKVNFLKMLDVIAPVLLMAQGIGRWGNYFNQELYGKPVEFNFWPFSVFIERTGQYHIGLFFVEFVLNIVGFFVLMTILKRYKNPGVVIAAYFIWYGLTRFILEPMRVPEFFPQGRINAFVVISGIFMIVGALFYIYLFYIKFRQSSNTSNNVLSGVVDIEPNDTIGDGQSMQAIQPKVGQIDDNNIS
ncbi:MAG: prolipoprotein diacylglyceryl transferase [Clostridiales bacterium]|jgi:phosphatidylglycerol:prolipoprotein diacylglycerol transferase|nr:prolipoprotein diacylglyceryl transferase [Clostridiales bacterium]